MMLHACNPSYSEGWGRRIAWTREAQVALSWDGAIGLQPGQQPDTVSKKKERNRKHTVLLKILSCTQIDRNHTEMYLNYEAAHQDSLQYILAFRFGYTIYRKDMRKCDERIPLQYSNENCVTCIEKKDTTKITVFLSFWLWCKSSEIILSLIVYLSRSVSSCLPCLLWKQIMKHIITVLPNPNLSYLQLTSFSITP